jgi:hypothetical protein
MSVVWDWLNKQVVAQKWLASISATMKELLESVFSHAV